VTLQPEHDVVRLHEVEEFLFVVDLDALASDPVMEAEDDRLLRADLFQILGEPVERLLRDVSPVLQQHARIERDEVDVLVVPALIERLARSARVTFFAARVPANVVVAGRRVMLHVAEVLDGLLVQLVLLVRAVLADVAGGDDEFRLRLEIADLGEELRVGHVILARADVDVGGVDEDEVGQGLRRREQGGGKDEPETAGERQAVRFQDFSCGMDHSSYAPESDHVAALRLAQQAAGGRL
jgi:hypothetical protein